MQVPTYDNYKTAPTVPNMPAAANTITPEEATIGSRQMEQYGDALQRAGDAGTKIAIDVQDQANQLRVDDAVNQVRQRSLDLAYNPDDGYLNLKGGAALHRPDGLALPDEYGNKLQETVSTVSGSLGNDAQRRAFQMRANDLTTGFKGDVQQHMLSEFNTYHTSVADGNAKLSTQEAELNWQNPQKIDAAIHGTEDPATGERFGGLRQAIYQKAKLTGMSANEAEAAMNDAESSIHANVIKSAITNGNITYANSYLNKNKGSMVAGDILTVQGMVDQKMDVHTALAATNLASQQFGPAFQPNDMDRLTNVVLGQESGGKRYGGAGSVAGPGDLTTSPKGAKGEMQVLDGTNKDPGFGVVPAKDDSPEERARVGRDYLGAMVKRYGNVPQALAAYNAGPGNVDEAIEQAKSAGNANTWMEFLPDETQKYVVAGNNKFQAGGGTPKMPTEADFINTALAQLGDNPRMEAVSATREQAEKQYKMLTDSRKQQGDAALANAQQELIANGGNFGTLKPETLTALSQYNPEQYKAAQDFAKSISDNNQTTNMEAYHNAVLHPNELAQMSEPQFMQFVTTNFSKDDQMKVTKMRADQMNGTSDTSAQMVNVSFINSTLATRLQSLGINPAPKANDPDGMKRVGGIQKFVIDDLFDQQKATGRKFNEKEIQDRIDTLFSSTVKLPGLFSDTDQPLMTMEYGDIPFGVRTKLRNQFVARNIKPSNDQILEAYRRWKKSNA